MFHTGIGKIGQNGNPEQARHRLAVITRRRTEVHREVRFFRSKKAKKENIFIKDIFLQSVIITCVFC